MEVGWKKSRWIVLLVFIGCVGIVVGFLVSFGVLVRWNDNSVECNADLDAGFGRVSSVSVDSRSRIVDQYVKGERGQRLADALADEIQTHHQRCPLPKLLLSSSPRTAFCNDVGWTQILNGDKRIDPVRIISVSPLNAELDLLFLRLHEQHFAVDFFIFQQSSTSHSALRKPLFSSFIPAQTLAPFQDQLIWTFVDDLELVSSANKARNLNPAGSQQTSQATGTWIIEGEQRKKLSRRLLRHAEDLGLKDQDLIIYGDADELIPGDALWMLKHCQERSPDIYPIRANSVMFMLDTKWVLRSDWPPNSNLSYSMGFPVILRVADLKTRKKLPRFDIVSTKPFESRPVLPAFGWHFSGVFLRSPAELLYKWILAAEQESFQRGAHYAMNLTQLESDTKSGAAISRVFGNKVSQKLLPFTQLPKAHYPPAELQWPSVYEKLVAHIEKCPNR
mmetsp:Transcript_3893/g.6802  ORF Transcript_3893/g.6802 Transcript_3893/m.6802 type:complete len:448 (+) Transcript_3893:2567-3910(+)